MQTKRVHCVGIGGIGISAIARVLLEQGSQVTGSDLQMSPVARALVGELPQFGVHLCNKWIKLNVSLSKKRGCLGGGG